MWAALGSSGVGKRRRRKGHGKGDGREKYGLTARGGEPGSFVYLCDCLLALFGNFFEVMYVLTTKTTGKIHKLAMGG